VKEACQTEMVLRFCFAALNVVVQVIELNQPLCTQFVINPELHSVLDNTHTTFQDLFVEEELTERRGDTSLLQLHDQDLRSHSQLQECHSVCLCTIFIATRPPLHIESQHSRSRFLGEPAVVG
jgi:hypothetical protein